MHIIPSSFSMRSSLHAVLLTLATLAPAAYAQTAPTSQPVTPPTKLEAFESSVGAVIIRGFQTVGTVRGEYGTSVEVEARELTNASTRRKEYGITVEVKGSRENSSTSYIDYDEIQGLIEGLNYVGGVTSSVTQLSSFQADFRTRGDLSISTFSSESRVMLAIQSGRIGRTSAYFPVAKLAEFRALLEQAKARLDAIK